MHSPVGDTGLNETDIAMSSLGFSYILICRKYKYLEIYLYF